MTSVSTTASSATPDAVRLLSPQSPDQRAGALSAGVPSTAGSGAAPAREAGAAEGAGGAPRSGGGAPRQPPGPGCGASPHSSVTLSIPFPPSLALAIPPLPPRLPGPRRERRVLLGRLRRRRRRSAGSSRRSLNVTDRRMLKLLEVLVARVGDLLAELRGWRDRIDDRAVDLVRFSEVDAALARGGVVHEHEGDSKWREQKKAGSCGDPEDRGSTTRSGSSVVRDAENCRRAKQILRQLRRLPRASTRRS